MADNFEIINVVVGTRYCVSHGGQLSLTQQLRLGVYELGKVHSSLGARKRYEVL
jgi:hypothetical protein